MRPHKICFLGPHENRRDLVGTPGHSGQPADQRKFLNIQHSVFCFASFSSKNVSLMFAPCRDFDTEPDDANIMTAILTYSLITGKTHGPLPRLRHGQHQGR